MAQSILDGVNRYKQAVTGQMLYQKPSAVVSATDPTSIPNLDSKPSPTPSPNPVGSKTDDKTTVAQAKEALENAVKGN